jgi:hypothetical protein
VEPVAEYRSFAFSGSSQDKSGRKKCQPVKIAFISNLDSPKETNGGKNLNRLNRFCIVWGSSVSILTRIQAGKQRHQDTGLPFLTATVSLLFLKPN